MDLEFRGKHAEFFADTTPEIDLEGTQSSGKTIVGLWKDRWPRRRERLQRVGATEVIVHLRDALAQLH